ncbi:ABC transporter ATP-binding protein [Lactococcus lactis subsp. lactis]|uniref:ATP-binding cassette domain-containing protein n=2 Tax=Lactococcus lactis TaxID=1358 RepID=A0A5M9PX55_LACLH|nr:ATP-binding cassette domain-containing protein [Lactococcus lactis]KAA8701034.1 ATP-binding cassette domain-containing protein [Lactococcus lactis subsp. hordniae]KSU13932.1 ABC transporter ATP-binding protein [Lactococcus lactis subsp. lactis]MCT3135544.1 ATP-binding cassette domain-containing protein [Lactococcus lactis]
MISVDNLYIKEIDRTISVKFSKGINFLKGSNGSGKTLLLDYLSGLRKLKNKKNVKNQNSNVYMRQNFSFYTKITAYEFINFIEKLNGYSVQHFFNFLEEYVPNYDFNLYKAKKLGLLSGCERRYLYILAILSIKRDLYILDEPFSNIDQETKEELIKLIEKIQYKQNSTFIITSHESLTFKNINIFEFSNISIQGKVY